jgi:site-specific recombinase XerC
MVPLQTWEGYVTSVIPEERRFTADLHDKAVLAQSYSAEISLTEIDPEDLELVKEGAVFYWTFGKVNVSRASPVNYDQIRFRRLPNWTKTRLETATRKATELYDFFKDAE